MIMLLVCVFSTAYGKSKLANVLFSNELSKRYNADANYKGRKIESNSLHPGTISTDLTRHAVALGESWGLKPIIPTVKGLLEAATFMTADDGALTQLYVATSPKAKGVTGKYFVPVGIERPPSKAGRDEVAAARLWELSEKYTGTA
jgi:retinol dehydrogenase-12